MNIASRFTHAIAAALGAILLASGCHSVEVSAPIRGSHRYEVDSRSGDFTVQQAARGRALQWGTYPNAVYSGTKYQVEVRVNGTRYGAKNQHYAPHGSVDAATARRASGRLLTVAGTVSKARKVVLVFTMQCRIM